MFQRNDRSLPPWSTDGDRSDLAGEGRAVVHRTGPADVSFDFALSVVAGMERRPRSLDCRFLYDARGSALYERITEQPEYYPTRTEAAILARTAPHLRALCGDSTLLEFGSGSSLKTDYLLRAWLAAQKRVRYIPVDVSESALLQASYSIARRHPRVTVAGIHGTYEDAFSLLADASPVLTLFLGSTIGNFTDAEAKNFLRRLAAALGPRDRLLLGMDLIKEPATLEAAYNDAAGITASFTRNLFRRMNRELDARLDMESIEHVARWQPECRHIEISARFHRPQTLHVAPLARQFSIAAGEEIRVEISRKFDLAELPGWFAACGLTLREAFTDDNRWFALLLLEPAAGSLS